MLKMWKDNYQLSKKQKESKKKLATRRLYLVPNAIQSRSSSGLMIAADP